MKVYIEDAVNGVCVVTHQSGAFSPDVMVDPKNRAIEAYREALVHRVAIHNATCDGGCEDDE